ncbi:MAG: hypothetical protein H8E19_07425 [Deltaproteobacteria bacterium]|uniref:Uncharacterized protein n=1 Tax=Candidatus Desulfacyla euxinica TaxID=2841693 RepID=A0A8J6MZG1_9DELT|nr:hypothetical protein [Candidatus Desulfacyla euxinica]
MKKCQICNKRYPQPGKPYCWQCRGVLDADLGRSFEQDRQRAQEDLKRQAQENYEGLLQLTTKTFFGIKTF